MRVCVSIPHRDRRTHKEPLHTTCEAVHLTEPTASAASAAAAVDPSPTTNAPPNPQQETTSSNPFTATSTGAGFSVVVAPPSTEHAVYLQPQTVERTIVQSAPLPDDLVHTSLLTGATGSRSKSQIAEQITAVKVARAILPQQVAANGNGILHLRRGRRWRRRRRELLGRRLVKRRQLAHRRSSNPGRTLSDRPSHRQHDHRDQLDTWAARLRRRCTSPGATTLDTPLARHFRWHWHLHRTDLRPTTDGPEQRHLRAGLDLLAQASRAAPEYGVPSRAPSPIRVTCRMR